MAEETQVHRQPGDRLMALLRGAARKKNPKSGISPLIQSQWKASVVHKALDMKDPWRDEHIENFKVEHGVEHLFDAMKHEWGERSVYLKVQPEPFAAGALRHCFRVKMLSGDEYSPDSDPWLSIASQPLDLVVNGLGKSSVARFCARVRMRHTTAAIIQALSNPKEGPHLMSVLMDSLKGSEANHARARDGIAKCMAILKEHKKMWQSAPNYVIKEYMIDGADRKPYFVDVEMQMVAKHWAELYNMAKPPKPIDVLQASAVELVDRAGSPLFACETFVAGEYVKYTSNAGYVGELMRATPQAFSHFSFVASEGQEMVVDIQGVGDLYTDPQIHTISGEGFGSGNLGAAGMARFFASHVCSELCQWMGLTHVGLAPGQQRRALSAEADQRKALGLGMMTVTSPALTMPDDSPVLRHSTTVPPTHRDAFERSPDDLTRRAMSNPIRPSSSPSSAETPPPRRSRPPPLPSPTAEELIRKSSSRETTGSNSGAAAAAIASGGGFGAGAGSEAHRPAPISVPDDRVPAPPMDALDIRRALSVTRHAVAGDSPAMTATPGSAEIATPAAVNLNLGLVHLAMAKHHSAGEYSDRRADMPSALHHLRQAAGHGVTDAVVALASLYQGLPNDVVADLEDSVSPDPTEARAWLEMAAHLGHRSSMVTVAKQCQTSGRVSEAIDWYNAVLNVDDGIPESSRTALDTKRYQVYGALGDLLLKGGRGVMPDPEAAADMYDQAQEAAMAHPSGQSKFMAYMAKAEEARASSETVSSLPVSGLALFNSAVAN